MSYKCNLGNVGLNKLLYIANMTSHDLVQNCFLTTCVMCITNIKLIRRPCDVLGYENCSITSKVLDEMLLWAIVLAHNIVVGNSITKTLWVVHWFVLYLTLQNVIYKYILRSHYKTKINKLGILHEKEKFSPSIIIFIFFPLSSCFFPFIIFLIPLRVGYFFSSLSLSLLLNAMFLTFYDHKPSYYSPSECPMYIKRWPYAHEILIIYTWKRVVLTMFKRSKGCRWMEQSNLSYRRDARLLPIAKIRFGRAYHG